MKVFFFITMSEFIVKKDREAGKMNEPGRPDVGGETVDQLGPQEVLKHRIQKKKACKFGKIGLFTILDLKYKAKVKLLEHTE